MIQMVKNDSPDCIRQALLLGQGGAGKTLTINAVCHTLEQEFGVGCVLRFAPTGKAACLIGGSTLHSHQSGIGLPTSIGRWKELGSESLLKFERNFEKCLHVVVDEFSMMQAHDVYFMDLRLRQIKGRPNDPFGGLSVIFVGDPAQIPPPSGDVLWQTGKYTSHQDELGHFLYKTLFRNVIRLDQQMRVESGAPVVKGDTIGERLGDDGSDKIPRVYTGMARHALDTLERGDILVLREGIELSRTRHQRDGLLNKAGAIVMEGFDNAIRAYCDEHDKLCLANADEASSKLLDGRTYGLKRDTGEVFDQEFVAFQGRIRTGKSTIEDYKALKNSASQSTVSREDWAARFGEPPNDVTYLFTNNKQVKEYNGKKLKNLGNPIVLCTATQSGPASQFDDKIYRGLGRHLFLAAGAKVVLNNNIAQPAGLANGTVGILKDLVYDADQPPPRLPKYVWVDFREGYTGPTFFPADPTRRGWVPVHPLTVSKP